MASKTGIERVQAELIEPLVRMGMRKAGNVTAEDHAAFLGRLAERLAYLVEDQLLTLREVLGRHGQGKARDVWPSELSVLSWAHALFPPPESRLASSWMASVEGRRAWDEDPLLAVALHRHLRATGVPPQTRAADHWPGIRSRAAEWARRRTRIEERRDRGPLGGEDAVWLAGLQRALDEVRALVFRGAGTGAAEDAGEDGGAGGGAGGMSGIAGGAGA
ncbi:MAG: hypothetical protein BWX69_03066 [Planctomycetes bacterium ADurb.Bin069]|nr:MAG: hypothetical protein BWX69_03066 [Planctomycetes bacterium ADurb.Bin069]